MTSFARFLASTTVQPSPVRVPAIEPTNFFIAPLLIHGGATTIGFGGRCDKDLVCRGACLSGIVGGAKRRNKRPLWSRWNALQGRVLPFATGSSRPDAHVWRDLAVSRVLTHSAIAWNELWDAFRSGRKQSLFRHISAISRRSNSLKFTGDASTRRSLGDAARL